MRNDCGAAGGFSEKRPYIAGTIAKKAGKCYHIISICPDHGESTERNNIMIKILFICHGRIYRA